MKPFDWFKRKVSDDDLTAYPERTALEAQATSLLTNLWKAVPRAICRSGVAAAEDDLLKRREERQ
jgi:hypothetical protein